MAVRMGPSFGAEDEATGLLTLEEAEKSYIRRVLNECKGHRQKAANILGISERTLYRKLQEIGEIQSSP
jgi:DNA-binding NtrC family response regulator